MRGQAIIGEEPVNMDNGYFKQNGMGNDEKYTAEHVQQSDQTQWAEQAQQSDQTPLADQTQPADKTQLAEFMIQAQYDELLQSKRIIRKVGWTLFIMAVASIASQYLIFFIAEIFFPEITSQGWFLLAVTALSVMGITLPLVCGMLKNVPGQVSEPKARLNLAQFLGLFFVCASLMYLANFISVFITYIISIVRNRNITDHVSDIITGSDKWITIAYVAILGPIVEEVIFRKILLDRMRRFGDVPAILFTGFAFGLFHMNIAQFFYATVLGIIFAYVTIRTNTIRYSVLLHIMINTIGSVIAPAAAFSGNYGLTMLIGLWAIVAIIIGLVLLISNRKRILLVKSSKALVNKAYYFFNPGMLLFSLLCIVMMILTLLA
jgi:membrane protease YdiL (CAAX protease family)